MSTIQSFTQHTTALCLALFLAACSGPAPVNDGSATPSPGTKQDLTSMSASPTTGSDSQSAAAERPLQSAVPDKELDAQMPQDDTPATKLYAEEVYEWEAIDKGKPSDGSSEAFDWDVAPGYEVVNDNQIRIFFQSGPRECYGHRVEVKETDKDVTITLFHGLVSQSKDRTCPAIATYRSTLVDLKEPLGDRKVIAGRADSN